MRDTLLKSANIRTKSAEEEKHAKQEIYNQNNCKSIESKLSDDELDFDKLDKNDNDVSFVFQKGISSENFNETSVNEISTLTFNPLYNSSVNMSLSNDRRNLKNNKGRYYR